MNDDALKPQKVYFTNKPFPKWSDPIDQAALLGVQKMFNLMLGLPPPPKANYLDEPSLN